MRSVLIKAIPRRKHRGEGDVKIEEEIAVMWPQGKKSKKCLEPPEAERHKEQNLPLRATGGNTAPLTS